jgi:hypothetical protein
MSPVAGFTDWMLMGPPLLGWSLFGISVGAGEGRGKDRSTGRVTDAGVDYTPGGHE